MPRALNPENLIALRPESSEEIVPYLNDATGFPVRGEARWVMEPLTDHSLDSPFSSPTYFGLTRRMRGLVRKLSSGSVHSVESVHAAEGELSLYSVTINGVDDPESRPAATFMLPASISSDPKMVAAAGIFRFLNKSEYESPIDRKQYDRLIDARHERERALREFAINGGLLVALQRTNPKDK